MQPQDHPPALETRARPIPSRCWRVYLYVLSSIAQVDKDVTICVLRRRLNLIIVTIWVFHQH